MTNKNNIDYILRSWPFDPDEVSVRVVEGADKRDVLQMRVEMGLLQLETAGRPDGERPNGYETYFDYLLAQTVSQGDKFVMDEEQCRQADREFVQYYHRRICWLALRRYEQAVQDATHTLGLMDLCKKHSPDEDWTMTHEQYRPFVLFHRTQADALHHLEKNGEGADSAISAINSGLDKFRDFFVEHELEERFDEDELVTRLVELRESLRERFDVGQTLQEQLAAAIASEQYELAAQLRDQLQQRPGQGR